MRLRLLLPVLCGACAWAADSANTTRTTSVEPSAEEIQTIRRIMELPPERLRGMRLAIEHIEHMSSDDRREFAKKLAEVENASPEERRKAFKELRERNGSRNGPGFSVRVLEYHLKQMPPEQAKEEREKFVKLPPEERFAYIRKLMEKYGPEMMKEAKAKAGQGKDGDGKRRAAPERPQPEAAPAPAGQQ